MSLEAIISAIASGGGMSLIMGLLGRYFVVKLLKQFEEMGKAITKIETKMAVHEALRDTEKSNTEELKDLREKFILLDSRVNALWRREDSRG